MNIRNQVIATLIAAGIVGGVSGTYAFFQSKIGASIQALDDRLEELQNAEKRIDAKLASISSEVEEQILAFVTSGTEIPSTGGNTKSISCPQGTFMIGVRYHNYSGDKHGITSSIWPVCRTIGGNATPIQLAYQ